MPQCDIPTKTKSWKDLFDGLSAGIDELKETANPGEVGLAENVRKAMFDSLYRFLGDEDSGSAGKEIFKILENIQGTYYGDGFFNVCGGKYTIMGAFDMNNTIVDMTWVLTKYPKRHKKKQRRAKAEIINCVHYKMCINIPQ